MAIQYKVVELKVSATRTLVLVIRLRSPPKTSKAR